MHKMCFYRKDLEKMENVKIEPAKFKEINFNSFFILDDWKLLIYFNRGQNYQKLPYEHNESIFPNNEIESSAKDIELITVKTQKGPFSFYVNKEGEGTEILLAPESISIDLEIMPFLRDSLLDYRDYDIEWVGDNYQVTDYFTSKLVSNSSYINEVYQDIDNFLEWKNQIPIDPDYYREKGYEIKVVSSGERYPVFPYTFEIYGPNDIYMKGLGISNVFDTEEDAILKACCKLYQYINDM